MKIKYLYKSSTLQLTKWLKTFCVVPFLLSPSLAFAYAEKNYLSIFLNVLIDLILDACVAFAILAAIHAGISMYQGKSIKIHIISIIVATAIIFSAPYLVHTKFGL